MACTLLVDGAWSTLTGFASLVAELHRARPNDFRRGDIANKVEATRIGLTTRTFPRRGALSGPPTSSADPRTVPRTANALE